MKKNTILITFCIALILQGCLYKDKDNHTEYSVSIDSMNIDSLINATAENPSDTALIKKIFVYMSTSGMDDRLIDYSKRILENYDTISNNSSFKTLIAEYIAYPYISTNRFDSARIYLDYLKNNLKDGNIRKLHYYNAEAIYYLKHDLDYPKAMNNLMKALQICKDYNQTESQAVILCNIASLYCDRKDTASFNYANQAYHIAYMTGNVYLKCLSLSVLAKSELLSGRYNEGLIHTKEAKDIISKYKYLNLFYPIIETVSGNIYMEKGDKESALACFNMAFENIKYNPDSEAHIDLIESYAKFLYNSGNYIDAISEYKKAYHISLQSEIIYHIPEILLGISESYANLNMTDSSLAYYRKYHEKSTEIFNINKEKEFNQLFLDYEKVKRKNLEQQNMLIKEKSNRIISLSITGFIFLATIILVLYLSFRQKNKMYLKLVEQYQKRISSERDNNDRKEKSNSRETKEKELFKKIESLIVSEKLYTSSDISLDKLASILDTNRTYLSKIVNKYSGLTFPNYINYYRIKEATSLLSDPDKEVVLKVLYEKLGYKSLTSFYRAFQKETGCPPIIYRKKIIELTNKKQASYDNLDNDSQ